MDQIFKFEQPAGEKRLIVMFINQDVSEQVDPEALMAEVGQDAAEREPHGWQLLSLGTMPLRQSRMIDNALFQVGGEFPTQVAVVAVYAR